jgi:hypothetical protein
MGFFDSIKPTRKKNGQWRLGSTPNATGRNQYTKAAEAKAARIAANGGIDPEDDEGFAPVGDGEGQVLKMLSRRALKHDDVNAAKGFLAHVGQEKPHAMIHLYLPLACGISKCAEQGPCEDRAEGSAQGAN